MLFFIFYMVKVCQFFVDQYDKCHIKLPEMLL